MSAKARRILALFRDPGHRERLLQSMNRENLDDVGPVGFQDQQMRILGEMNELGERQEQVIRDSVPKITIY